jgi:hypothetical protein
MQGLQDFEGLRHLERGVIREHDPTRILPVALATWPIMTSGAELAMVGRLWCSASQYRS